MARKRSRSKDSGRRSIERPPVEALEPRQLLAGFDFQVAYQQVPSYSVRPIAADFNVDGHADVLVIITNGSRGVSVLPGNGRGGLGSAIHTFLPAILEHHPAVGDIDGDGKPDLIAPAAGTDPARGGLLVARGNGDGTFAQPTIYSIGREPRGVAVADFNGDGKLDVAATSPLDVNLSVLLNTGDGTLAEPLTIPLDGTPSNLLARDLNGDGKVDLLVADEDYLVLHLLAGAGDGTFSSRLASTPGRGGFIRASADFNNDGLLDVVVNDAFSPGRFSVLKGRADGTFGSPAPFGPLGGDFAAGDFDGDGNADLASFFFSDMVVLPGRGDGTFGDQIKVPIGSYSNFGPFPVADFNHDGRDDFATVLTQAVAVYFERPIQAEAVPVTTYRAVNVPVATFEFGRDEDPATFAATIDWGDGITSTGTITKLGSKTYGVNGTHTYQSDKPVGVRVTISNGYGHTAEVSAQTQIADIPSSNIFTEFPLPGTQGFPGGITVGPDGALWFNVDGHARNALPIPFRIGRLTTAGALTEFPLKPPAGGDTSIAAAADGHLWFLLPPMAIGRMTPAGVVTEFPIPQLSGAPATARGPIIAGPHGGMWFGMTAGSAHAITRVGDDGEFTIFPIATTGGVGSITTGEDGAIWFTLPNDSKIGRLTPEGDVRLFSLASAPTAAVRPLDLVWGPDGAIWYTNPGADTIGRLSVDTGRVDAFPLPGSSDPHRIIVGPDDALWFTEYASSRVTRMTLTGELLSVQTVRPENLSPALTGDSDFPLELVNGPDGNIWVTLVGGKAVARLNLAAITPMTVVPAISARKDQAYGGTVATFRDAVSGRLTSDYRVVIDWGDGRSRDAEIVPTGDGGHEVRASHTYASEGRRFARLTLFAPGEAAITAAIPVLVDYPLTAVGQQRHYAVEGQTLANVRVASFTDEDTGSTPSRFAATIDWGDGSTSPGTVTKDATGTYHVAGSHLYARDGNFTVSVHVEDVGGSTVDVPAAVRILNPVSVTDRVLYEGGTSQLAIADYDGDGHLDVATPGYGPEGRWIATLLGTGDGAFPSSPALTRMEPQTNNPVAGLVTGDFDDDGLADLALVVSTGFDTARLQVYLSNGDGTFTPGFAFHGAGLRVMAADMNTDGRADLVTHGPRSNVISVLLANGDGTFTTHPTTLPIGEHRYGTIADFDGDGRMDIAVGTSEQTAIHVLPGNGDGTFGQHTTLPGIYAFVTAADFNRDGNQDLVAVSDAFNILSVRLGNGDLTFDAPLEMPYTSPGASPGLSRLIAVDVNGDAIPDLLRNGDVAWALRVRLGNGDGTFQPDVVLPAGNFPAIPDVADLNEDGRADVISTSGQGVLVLLGSFPSVAYNLTGTEDAALQQVRIARFSDDLSPDAVASDFPVTIDWGDGTTSAGSVVAAGDGYWDVFGSHRYAEGGSYAITVRTKNSKGTPSVSRSTATIANLPLVGSSRVVAGQVASEFTAVVAGFTNPDLGDPATAYTAAINWGDGQFSDGTVTATGDGRFTVSGTHAYSRAGLFSVTVTIRDRSGEPLNVSSTARVEATEPPTATLSAPDLVLAGAAAHRFTVTYRGEAPIDASSIGTKDVLVTGPNGFSQLAIYVSQESGNADGTERTATYRLTPPFGSWTSSDDGVYQITLQANEVRDVLGNGVAPQPLGSFEARVFAHLAAGGPLTITGTAGPDDVRVTREGQQLHARLNGRTLSLSFQTLPQLIFNTSGGDDTVTIDSSLPTVPVFNLGTERDSINLNAGTYALTPGALAGVNLSIGSATVTIPAETELRSLTLGNGARASVVGTGHLVLTGGGLSFTGTGQLELHDNALVVRTAGLDQEAVLAALGSAIRSARDGSARWKGPGLASSAAAIDPNTGLAVALRDGEIVVRYGYNGDANLDGRVNADDYFKIDSGFLSQNASPDYQDGDFNYDGRINADDYFLIDSAFLGQQAILSEASPTASTALASRSDVTSAREKKQRRSFVTDRPLFSTSRIDGRAPARIAKR